MIKKNNLRKVYLVYIIALCEIFCVAYVLCSSQIQHEPLKTIIKAAGFAGMVLIPVFMVFFYRWRSKDNAGTSDELEQLVLTKALAAAGLVSISLLPFLLLLCALFSDAAGYIAFGFAVAVGATFKLGTVYYHKKY